MKPYDFGVIYSRCHFMTFYFESIQVLFLSKQCNLTSYGAVDLENDLVLPSCACLNLDKNS